MCSSLSENNTFNNAVGVVAGYGTYKYGGKLIKAPFRYYLENDVTKIPTSQNNAMFEAGKKALDNHWLKSKGVNIHQIDTKNCYELIEEMNIKNKKESQKIPKCISFILDKIIHEPNIEGIKEIAEGKNACYAADLNKVIVNSDKMGFSVFHELGHAVNDKCKGIKNVNLNFSRAGSLLMLPILLTALLHKSQPENQEKKKHRILDFIKNNCGTLVGLCTLPVIAEEGLASLNGHKIAKKVLSSEQLKQVDKLNAKAFCSYILAGAAAYLLANLAVKVKDKVASN